MLVLERVAAEGNIVGNAVELITYTRMTYDASLVSFP